MQLFSTADRALAARLEEAEASNGLHMAQSASRSVAHVVAEPIAGGTAIFAGLGSPMTHALGIGLGDAVPDGELERLEKFFFDRESACLIDLCPLVDTSVLAFVQSRPYRVIEFNNVMVRRLVREESFAVSPDVLEVERDGITRWAGVVAKGFSDNMLLSEEDNKVLAASCSDAQCWLAGEGDPTAGAAMRVEGKVALLLGDATQLAARGRGLQSRLIQARLASANQQGCELAMASVLPGSASHRNYERAGFQLVYMRVNLVCERPLSRKEV